MAYGAQGATDPYAADYTEMERRLALRQQAQNRQALESLASQGALTGGARQAREQEVNAGIGELWHSGAQAIESRRFAANEAETQRTWQTGERTGAEAATASLQQNQIEAQEAMQNNQITQDQWSQLNANEQEQLMAGTNARYASNLSAQEAGQTLTQMGAGFGYNQQLQAQAEAAAAAAQQAGFTQDQWSQLTANQQQTLMQQSDQAQQILMQAGLFGQQTAMQGTDIANQQWLAQFGQAGAMDLQNNANAFSQAQADQARQWGIDDRPWEQQQWLQDAQLQITVSGYHWNDDGESGGAPWFVHYAEQGSGSYSYVTNPDGTVSVIRTGGAVPASTTSPPASSGYAPPSGGGGSHSGGGHRGGRT